MRSSSPSRSRGGTILRFLIILGLVAYTGFIALKLTKQVPMNSFTSVAAPDASLAGAVLDNQDHFLNLPQGAAQPAPDVPAPPGDQSPVAAAHDDGAQDSSDSGVDAPSPDQPQNVIHTVPAAPAGDSSASAPDAGADNQAAATAPDTADDGAPVVPIDPNGQSDSGAGAPVVPLNPPQVPADSAHKDQLRQFLHDSLQRALHNPQQ